MTEIDLRFLLAPRSIAIVGASDTPGPSTRFFSSLQTIGFAGEIFAVNPTRDHALGRRCYPSLAALPEPPDAAVLCISPDRVAAAVLDAAAAGVRAVVSYASGVQHTQHDGLPAIELIQQTCARAGIAFCGPDCMGVLNPASRSTLYLGQIENNSGVAGEVGLITQSGSMAIGLLTDVRRHGYSHLISTGQEAVLNAAHYLAALAESPDTRIIAMFLEAVRDMPRFTAALDLARANNKPVVVLKVGKTEASRHAALGHTGGIAGDARAFSTILRRHGAIEVSRLEDMIETIAVLRASRRPRSAGIGIVSPSGGHVEYALDVAGAARIDLPPMTEAARADLAATIGPFAGSGNPIDAWGNGDFEKNMRAALATFAASPDHGAIVLITDTMDGQPTRPTRYVDAIVDVAAQSDKPFYMVSSRSGLFRQDYADRLEANGAFQLSGIEPALRAIGAVAAWQNASSFPPRQLASFSTATADLPAMKAWLNEGPAKAFLRRCGFSVPQGRLADADEVDEVARAVGYPLALKVIDDRIPHRTPYGLVALDIADKAALHDAAAAIHKQLVQHFPECLGAPLLVERMTPAGLDVFVAVAIDPECGPTLTVGLGGFLLETVRDVVAIPLPSREGEVAAALRNSAIGRFLLSPSGHVFGGLEPLARFVENVGDLYLAMGDRLSLIELNPVRLVHGQTEPVILDALVATQEMSS